MVERYFAGLLLQLTNISHGERLSGGVSFVAIQVGVVGTIFFFVFLYMAEGKQRNLFICRTIFRGERKNVMIVPRFVTTLFVR